MKQKKRILFFTPYATRTGSEMLIYYILKYIDRTKFEAGLVCFSRGELLHSLPSDIPVFFAPRTFSLGQKIAFHLGFHPTTSAIKKISKKFEADLWYVNTVMLADVITVAKEMKIPVISHVQELSTMYSQVSKSDFKIIAEKSDMIIGCSDIVCKCMTESGGKRVERLYNFVDLKEIKSDPKRILEIRKEWGAEPDDFVWIMSGTSSERKGFDIIPDIALRFPKGAKVHFVWVGKLTEDGLVYWTEQRCKQIDNVKIHLIGAKNEDYYSYMDAADGFMLTSRQEPFGMVLVEAAWLGKPIVTFDSGGPTEFISPELGTVVPNLDIALFVESLQYWAENRSQYDPEKARKKVLEFDAEGKVVEWQQILDRF